jgi:hypothetical protein
MLFTLLFYILLCIKKHTRYHYQPILDDPQKSVDENLERNKQHPNTQNGAVLLGFLQGASRAKIELLCWFLNTTFILLITIVYVNDLIFLNHEDRSDDRFQEIVKTERKIVLFLAVISCVDQIIFACSLGKRLYIFFKCGLSTLFNWCNQNVFRYFTCNKSRYYSV